MVEQGTSDTTGFDPGVFPIRGGYSQPSFTKISRELHAPFTETSEAVAMKRVRSTLFLLPLLLLTASCSRHPRVTVVNGSVDPLTNLVVSGSGFSESLGSLAPGGQMTVKVNPSADTGLSLSFEAAGERHVPPPDGYFEASGHYRVKATVRPDFSVKIESEIR